MPREKLVTFIIPTLNEEFNVISAIHSIENTMRSSAYEVIVCDNGSQDKTRIVSEGLGARVFVDRNATIAGLRNFGVKHSSGQILVFIDADVTLNDDWYKNLESNVLPSLKSKDFITGSSCLTPLRSNFFEKNWFSKLGKSQTNYINSGHLIISRPSFDKLKGFDETLRTSEDYDLCQRAQLLGIQVVKSDALKAYHHGYPQKAIDFMAREAWHGSEDMLTIQKLLNSKTALSALFNVGLIAAGIVLLFTTGHQLYLIATISMSILICAAISFIKFGRSIKGSLIGTTICCELYLLGRAGSIFTRHKRPRARS